MNRFCQQHEINGHSMLRTCLLLERWTSFESVSVQKFEPTDSTHKIIADLDNDNALRGIIGVMGSLGCVMRRCSAGSWVLGCPCPLGSLRCRRRRRRQARGGWHTYSSDKRHCQQTVGRSRSIGRKDTQHTSRWRSRNIRQDKGTGCWRWEGEFGEMCNYKQCRR